VRRTQVCSRRLDLLELKRAWLADMCRAPPPAPRPAPPPGPEPRAPPDSGAKGELGTAGPPCGPALPSPAGAGSGVARIAAVAACSSDWPFNCAPQPAPQRSASAGAVAQPRGLAGLRPHWFSSADGRHRCVFNITRDLQPGDDRHSIGGLASMTVVLYQATGASSA